MSDFALMVSTVSIGLTIFFSADAISSSINHLANVIDHKKHIEINNIGKHESWKLKDDGTWEKM